MSERFGGTEDDRPTCESCPYWHFIESCDDELRVDGNTIAVNMVFAFCRRHAPTSRIVPPPMPVGTEEPSLLIPTTSPDDWCGDHPDMPEWIEAWRVSRGVPPRDRGTTDNRPVECLGLPARARRMVRRLEIKTVGDLTRKTAPELLECREFGEISLHYVRKALAKQGLKLYGD